MEAPSVMVVRRSQGVLMTGHGLGSVLGSVVALFIKKRGSSVLVRWVQWLKALTALAEDLEFSSQDPCSDSPPPSSGSRRFDALFLYHMHMVHSQTDVPCICKIKISKIQNNNNSKKRWWLRGIIIGCLTVLGAES